MSPIFHTLTVAAENGWLDYLRDPETLIYALLDQFGPWMIGMVGLIVFIESGVLFPVLPGDSLIFTLGILHNKIQVELWLTTLILIACAVAGNLVGYGLGVLFGEALFKPDARFLKTEYLDKARDFFNKYGGRSLVLARFVPFVRTFIPIAAGMARYRMRSFILWNTVGAIVWAGGLLILGELLGEIPFIKNNLEVIAIVIVFVSVLPIIIEFIKKYIEAKKEEAASAQPELAESETAPAAEIKPETLSVAEVGAEEASEK